MFCLLLLMQVDLDSIVVIIRLAIGNLQNGPGKIDHAVGGERITVSFGYLWTSNNEGDMYVLFVAECLSGIPAMSAESIAIIGGVEDVGILQLTSRLNLLDDRLDELIYGLQRSKTTSEEVVEISFLSGVLFVRLYVADAELDKPVSAMCGPTIPLEARRG